jgi:hypothetical protein
MVQILIQANIFPLKEFDTWEAMTPKTYPALKTFIHKAYSRRFTVMVLRSMSGHNGYARQTIYNILEAGIDDDTNNDTVTTITQTAAVTAATGSTTPSSSRAISAEVTAAINQLSANQATIMSQMAAMSFVPPPTQHTRAFVPRNQFSVPPIQQVAVLVQQPFAAVGKFNAGRGGQRGGRGPGQIGGRGGCSSMPFADAMRGRGNSPVGNLPKGYIRNVPLPQVPHGQSTRQSQVLPNMIPHYYEDALQFPHTKIHVE